MTNHHFNDMVSSTNGVKRAFLDQAIQQVLCNTILTVTFRDSYSYFKKKKKNGKEWYRIN